jgi:DNA-binding NtrC family response regulator
MAGSPARVLIVDDEESQRAGLAAMIGSWGFQAETACDGVEALEKLNQAPVDVLVTDLMMPRMDGFELLRRLAAQGGGPPAVVITAFGSIETAVATIHDLGAFWFLEKPIQPQALRLLLERAASQRRLAQETERLQRQLSYQGVLGELTGRSPAMQQVFSLIRQVAAPARNWWPAPSTRSAPGATVPSWRSTARRCRKRSWRANCSVTKKARSRGPSNGAWVASSWPTTARFCSMRSAICR